MKLTPFGAVGEVTGSCTLVETSKAKLLVDLGLHQGGREVEDDLAALKASLGVEAPKLTSGSGSDA